MTEPRFRISAKQTAKGVWYFDGTVEMDKPKKIVSPTNDVADITEIPAGTILLDLIKKTEEAFLRDGRQVAQGGLTV